MFLFSHLLLNHLTWEEKIIFVKNEVVCWDAEQKLQCVWDVSSVSGKQWLFLQTSKVNLHSICFSWKFKIRSQVFFLTLIHCLFTFDTASLMQFCNTVFPFIIVRSVSWVEITQSTAACGRKTLHKDQWESTKICTYIDGKTKS